MKYNDEKDLQNFKKLNTASWDTVKDSVFVRLMNEKYVSKYNENIAYVKFLDLAMTFSVQEKSNDTILSHMITKDDLSKWNVDLETVQHIAKHNTEYDRKKRIMTFKQSALKNNIMYPLLQVPQGLTMGVGGNSAAECGIIQDVDEQTGNNNIIVLCNKYDVFGAAYMTIPEVLEEVWSRFNGENFYIIPLSVHQVICVRNNYVTHDNEKPVYEVEDDLLDMIESFNDSNNKSWKDILSYKIYYYFGNDGKKLFLIK